MIAFLIMAMCLASYNIGSGDSSDMIAFVIMARDRATAMPHARALRVYIYIYIDR